MEINPQRVRTVEFGTARKGLDPVEVREFLGQVADELERAQNQATAMEARARAAVARLQQLTDENDVSGEVAGSATDAVATATADAPIAASVDDTETISRTMLLAQRAADLTVAEAEAEAARVRAEADEEAVALVEQARADARRAGESEREVVESEVNALVARRDFLESDVDHMEQFLVDQRTRLREAATAMIDISERVPGGLGDVRRPLLSASDDTDEPMDATMPYQRDADDPDDTLDASSAALDEPAAEPPGEPADGSPGEPTPGMRLSFDDG